MTLPRRWFGSIKQSTYVRRPTGVRMGANSKPEALAEARVRFEDRRYAALISAKSVKRANFKSFL